MFIGWEIMSSQFSTLSSQRAFVFFFLIFSCRAVLWGNMQHFSTVHAMLIASLNIVLPHIPAKKEIHFDKDPYLSMKTSAESLVFKSNPIITIKCEDPINK